MANTCNTRCDLCINSLMDRANADKLVLQSYTEAYTAPMYNINTKIPCILGYTLKYSHNIYRLKLCFKKL